MLKAIYIRFNGDLYEIVSDIFGDIEKIFVYRDNCNATAEHLDEENLPAKVKEEFNNKVAKWYTEL